jgi:hypothetical protein
LTLFSSEERKDELKPGIFTHLNCGCVFVVLVVFEGKGSNVVGKGDETAIAISGKDRLGNVFHSCPVCPTTPELYCGQGSLIHVKFKFRNDPGSLASLPINEV